MLALIPAFFVVICIWGFWPEKSDGVNDHKSDISSSSGSEINSDQISGQPEFMSMEAASRKAYAEARRVGSFWAHFAETSEITHAVGADRSRDDRILCDIANLIAGEIAIYGEASPSPSRDVICRIKCKFFGIAASYRDPN